MKKQYLLTSEKIKELYVLLQNNDSKKTTKKAALDTIASFFQIYNTNENGDIVESNYWYGYEEYPRAYNRIRDALEDNTSSIASIDLLNLHYIQYSSTYIRNILKLKNRELKIVVNFFLNEGLDLVKEIEEALLNNYLTEKVSYHSEESFLPNLTFFFEAINIGYLIDTHEKKKMYQQIMDIGLSQTKNNEKQKLLLLGLKAGLTQNIGKDQLLNYFIRFTQQNNIVSPSNKNLYEEVKAHFSKEELQPHLSKNDFIKMFSGEEDAIIIRDIDAFVIMININKLRKINNVDSNILKANLKKFGEHLESLCKNLPGYMSGSYIEKGQEFLFHTLYEKENGLYLRDLLEHLINVCTNMPQKEDKMYDILNKNKEVFLLNRKLEEAVSHKEEKVIKRNKL